MSEITAAAPEAPCERDADAVLSTDALPSLQAARGFSLERRDAYTVLSIHPPESAGGGEDVTVLVRQRTSELGVRTALGANRPGILRVVLGDAMQSVFWDS